MNKNRHLNDYVFEHYKDRIDDAHTEVKLAAIVDDIEGDAEAGNLSEEDVEKLRCLISDREGEILLEALEG